MSKYTALNEAKKAQSNFNSAGNSLGQYGRGNIDLYNRPKYRNVDGSISTVRSMSFNDGSGEILVPTIANVNGSPTLLNDNQAIDRYYDTGEYLGKFETPSQANAYANLLHKQQEAYYTPQKSAYLTALINKLQR